MEFDGDDGISFETGSAEVVDLRAKYIADHFSDANQKIAFLTHFKRNPLGVQKEMNNWYLEQSAGDPSALRTLRVDLEKELYPEAAEINSGTYDELKDVAFFMHGDILPGKHFNLDNPETWNREILKLHKTNTLIKETLEYAQRTGIMNSDRPREVALELYDHLLREFSESESTSLSPGTDKSLGNYFEAGGNCRHKASHLQLMLQEAGIASRYLRVQSGIEWIQGDISWYGRHAIVEVDIEQNGMYALLLDPNQQLRGTRTELNFSQYRGDLTFIPRSLLGMRVLDEDAKPHEEFGIDAATGAKKYAIPREHANVVWRPKSVVD